MSRIEIVLLERADHWEWFPVSPLGQRLNLKQTQHLTCSLLSALPPWLTLASRGGYTHVESGVTCLGYFWWLENLPSWRKAVGQSQPIEFHRPCLTGKEL